MKQTPNTCSCFERARIASVANTPHWRAVISRASRRNAIGLAARLLFAIAGSSVVCGSAFAAEHEPATAFGQLAGRSELASANKVGSAPSEPAIANDVLPVLKRTCVSCHGPEKVKAGLRLDTFEGIKKGGDNGAVIKPGKAKASPLIQRLLLPLKHDDHMPPADKPQPTAEEIALLRRWVDAGAPGDNPATTKLNPSVQTRPALASNQNAK